MFTKYGVEMEQYQTLLTDILENGEQRLDRTKIGTLAVFGRQLRFDLSKGFPAITTKKLAWKACKGELLWFLEGSGDERRLAEITHGTSNVYCDDGTRNPDKNTIWTGNAQAPYWQPKAKYKGDLGKIYGVQWRRWESNKRKYDFTSEHYVSSEPIVIDQINELIEGIKNDPNGRRHIISAWNVAELQEMALPPCHIMSQYYVSNTTNKLSCHMYQRSADAGLGIPFNIASYALLTHMIAQVCGLHVGELIISLGDAHVYKDHIPHIQEQLKREPLELPTLCLNSDIKNIDDFKMSDIHLLNYKHHPPIKMNMAV